MGIAIIMLIVIAIRWMGSSPSGKAQMGKTVRYYIAGAIFIFAAVGILQIVKNFSDICSIYVEPFCGGANSLSAIDFNKKLTSDSNKYVIAFWNDVKNNNFTQQMWNFVTKEFLTKHILFIGYSLADDNIIDIIIHYIHRIRTISLHYCN